MAAFVCRSGRRAPPRRCLSIPLSFRGDDGPFRRPVPAHGRRLPDAGLCWPPILARAEAPSALIPFAIPAQPLSQALVAYSRASGMTVLVDSGLTEGRQAPALDGRYTAGDALRRLLAGRPCRSAMPARTRSPWWRTRGRRVHGSHACATRPMPPACRPRCAASCARRPARGYRALVQLWFDGDARVSKMNWITRSGQAARDQALSMPWRTCARAPCRRICRSP